MGISILNKKNFNKISTIRTKVTPLPKLRTVKRKVAQMAA